MVSFYTNNLIFMKFQSTLMKFKDFALKSRPLVSLKIVCKDKFIERVMVFHK